MLTKYKKIIYIDLFSDIIKKLNVCMVLLNLINESNGLISDFDKLILLDNYSTFKKDKDTQFVLNGILWLRINGILYMIKDNIYYFTKNDNFYKIINSISVLDSEKTFKTFNSLYLPESQIICIFEQICKNINKMFDNLILTIKNNNLVINYIDEKSASYPIKLIDLSFFFSVTESYIYFKNVYEFYFNPLDNIIFVEKIKILILNFTQIINILQNI